MVYPTHVSRSYGITCIEIFTRGAEPYDGMANSVVLEKILAGFRIPRPERCPDGFYRKVIARCLSKDAADRPPFEELIGAIRQVSIEPDSSDNPTYPADLAAAPSAANATAAPVDATAAPAEKPRPLQYVNTRYPSEHAAAVDDFDMDVNRPSYKAAAAEPGSFGFDMGKVRPDQGMVENPLRGLGARSESASTTQPAADEHEPAHGYLTVKGDIKDDSSSV